MTSERQPRVIVVTDAILPWHVGGKEARWWEITQRAARRHNADITIATMNWPKAGSRTRLRAARWTDGPVRYKAVSGHADLYHGERRSVSQAVRFAAGCARLLFARFDIIEADHMPGPQLITLRAVTWLRRKPLVVCWNEIWGPQRWRDYLGRAGAIGAAMERLSARTADGNIAISPGTAQRVIDLGVPAGRVALATAGVDERWAHNNSGEERTIDVLYAGRLIAHKRVDLLLDAVEQLAGTGRRLAVTIIGDGPEAPALQARADELNERWPNVTVTMAGVLESREQVYDTMRQAKVFVSMSEREGFGMTVIEAALCGAASITSDHPDNEARHLVQPGETGDTSPAGDAAALAGTIARWLACANPDRIAAAAATGQHSWDDVADEWWAHIQRFAQRGRRP